MFTGATGIPSQRNALVCAARVCYGASRGGILPLASALPLFKSHKRQRTADLNQLDLVKVPTL